jgi:hypothetical protein
MPKITKIALKKHLDTLEKEEVVAEVLKLYEKKIVNLQTIYGDKLTIFFNDKRLISFCPFQVHFLKFSGPESLAVLASISHNYFQV